MFNSADYQHDLDGSKGAKLRELLPPGGYRTSTAFNAVFSSTRPRQHTLSSAPPGAPFLRDTSNFTQNYPIDVFGHTQPITSPTTQQPTSAAFDSMHQSRPAFDFPATPQQPIGPGLGTAIAKPAFNTEVFSNSNGNPSLIPSHKPNGIIPGPGAQQAPGPAQVNGFPGSQPYLNGGGHHHQAMQSQTPYGPHLPANATKVPPPAGQPALAQVAGSQSAPQEEISTIFVVGFPDDMQVRFC
jgi:hypothetical protein